MTSMQDIVNKIRQMIDEPEHQITASELEMWMNLYPYFVLPVIRYVRQNGASLDPARRRRLCQFIAMQSPDAAHAHDILADMCAGEPFYPEQARAATPSTESTIDTFLDRYGSSDPAQDALLERLIFNPTPDYAQQLAAEQAASLPAEDEAPEGSQDDLINRFILSHPQGERHVVVDDDPEVESPIDEPVSEADERTANPADDKSVKSAEPATTAAAVAPSALSLSLARIYIKQQRYDRAHEIITQLSLNNPEKSVYFADQLRFLDKLIRNQACRQAAK